MKKGNECNYYHEPGSSIPEDQCFEGGRGLLLQEPIGREHSNAKCKASQALKQGRIQTTAVTARAVVRFSDIPFFISSNYGSLIKSL